MASQSLSSRAMSFDEITTLRSKMEESQSLSSRAMSFDIDYNRTFGTRLSLNPFRAGRCLSTDTDIQNAKTTALVSIPFEQGDVFRHS